MTIIPFWAYIHTQQLNRNHSSIMEMTMIFWLFQTLKWFPYSFSMRNVNKENQCEIIFFEKVEVIELNTFFTPCQHKRRPANEHIYRCVRSSSIIGVYATFSFTWEKNTRERKTDHCDEWLWIMPSLPSLCVFLYARTPVWSEWWLDDALFLWYIYICCKINWAGFLNREREKIFTN